MKNKWVKRLLISIAVLAGLTVAAAAVSLTVLRIHTKAILDDYSGIYSNEKYRTPIMINRTSFEDFENMPLFLKLGFAFGVFEKNTIFRVQ